ncbi:hypothetical protein KUCAC02_034835, partial [Chaenocephalus aceratus]
DHIKQEVDEGKYCGMVMLDLQKAFDTVNHPILIDKLKAIGFDKLSVSWMQSYLEGREQMVEVNGTLSPPLPESGCVKLTPAALNMELRSVFAQA